jgi:hypothetical protein
MSTGPAQGLPVAENRPTRSATIVLTGAFNPLILQPQWLADHGVIDDHDLNALEESGQALISSDFTGVQFRGFSLEATRDRIQVSATQELETPLLLADVVGNVFSLLSHTPVRAVGLNHIAHVPIERDDLDALLSAYGPPERVQGVLGSAAVETVRWAAPRPDERQGVLRLTVEPSVLLSSGIFLSLNDHVDLGEEGTGADVAELLAGDWPESLQRAERLFATMVAVR